MSKTREIKFRGKRVDNGEWVWGWYFRTGLNRHYIKSHSNLKDYEVDPATVGQFTGILDVLGRDIYDGDICKDDTMTVEIVWRDSHHQWGCKIISGNILAQGLTFPLWQWNECEQNVYRDDYRGLEIIGTIHDKEATQCTK